MLVRCIIEEFFKNQYSTNQRYVMLNALALGARELAGLYVPSSTIAVNRIAFPSKVLTPALHQKYLADSNQDSAVPQLLDGITLKAINRGKEPNADNVPGLVRERRLRLQTPARVTEVGHKLGEVPPSSKTSFNEVAAQFFIAPFINRFWLFLRDEQTREERTTHHEGRARYRGAGTGLILNPIVLSRFLSTLAIMVHASVHAPEWLAIIAPDSLELAITLGTRPVSLSEVEESEDDSVADGESKGKEASVLSTAMELALVVLDGCLEADGGRALSLDHSPLLLGTSEWASTVFAHLEKGAKVTGGGGAQEIKLRRAAAGLLLKADELTSRWRRSMVDMR